MTLNNMNMKLHPENTVLCITMSNEEKILNFATISNIVGKESRRDHITIDLRFLAHACLVMTRTPTLRTIQLTTWVARLFALFVPLGAIRITVNIRHILRVKRRTSSALLGSGSTRHWRRRTRTVEHVFTRTISPWRGHTATRRGRIDLLRLLAALLFYFGSQARGAIGTAFLVT